MNKNLLISILLTISLPSIWGQVSLPKQETQQQFHKSKTYIVLENAMFSQFNASIGDAARKHWEITPFEVIDYQKFEILSKNPQHSFLMLVVGEYTGIGKNAKFEMLTLVMGHKSGDINKMPEILSVPLAACIDENSNVDEEDFDYKMGGILKGMQYAAKNILNQNVGIRQISSLLNADAKEVKNMELWLTKNDLSEQANTIEKIQKTYPYKVLITTAEAIEQAIDNNRPNTAFVHKVGNPAMKNGICIKALISCENGKILYGNYHSVSAKEPNGLLLRDFEILMQ